MRIEKIICTVLHEAHGQQPGRPKGHRSGRAKRYLALKRPPEPGKTANTHVLR